MNAASRISGWAFAFMSLSPSLALAELSALEPRAELWRTASADTPLARRMSRLGALMRQTQNGLRDGADLATMAPLAAEMQTLFLESKEFPPRPMPERNECGERASEEDFRARLDGLAALANRLQAALAAHDADAANGIVSEMRAQRSLAHCVYNP